MFPPSFIVAFSICSLSSLSAATLWLGAVDDALNNAANWDNGLPSLTNPGTVNTGSPKSNSVSALNITITGTADFRSGDSTTTISNASIFTLAGSSTMDTRTDRNVNINNSSFYIQDNAYFSKRDVSFSNNSSGQMSGGTLRARKLNIYTTTFHLSGGEIYVNTLDGSKSEAHLTIGAGAAINFTSNSSGAIIWQGMNSAGVTDALNELNTFLDNGNITVDGNPLPGGSADLGNYFTISQTATGDYTNVSLQLIPEPTTTILLCLIGTLSLLNRKRKSILPSP